MAEFNFNLKIKTGKRTKLKVDCWPTSVNKKIMFFEGSDKTAFNDDLSEQIQRLIEERLKENLYD